MAVIVSTDRSVAGTETGDTIFATARRRLGRSMIAGGAGNDVIIAEQALPLVDDSADNGSRAKARSLDDVGLWSTRDHFAFGAGPSVSHMSVIGVGAGKPDFFSR